MTKSLFKKRAFCRKQPTRQSRLLLSRKAFLHHNAKNVHFLRFWNGTNCPFRETAWQIAVPLLFTLCAGFGFLSCLFDHLISPITSNTIRIYPARLPNDLPGAQIILWNEGFSVSIPGCRIIFVHNGRLPAFDPLLLHAKSLFFVDFAMLLFRFPYFTLRKKHHNRSAWYER